MNAVATHNLLWQSQELCVIITSILVLRQFTPQIRVLGKCSSTDCAQYKIYTNYVVAMTRAFFLSIRCLSHPLCGVIPCGVCCQTKTDVFL